MKFITMRSWFSVLLLVVLAVLAVVFAAPSEVSSSPGVELQTAPASALRVRVAGARFGSVEEGAGGVGGAGGAGRAGCSDSGCYSLCVALGWSGGFCLDADWCLCYR